jgi:hypothetical protein
MAYTLAKIMKKWITTLAILACVAGGVMFYLHERHDLHHTAYRRDWKNNAIREIHSDIANPKHFIERFGSEPAPRGDFDTSGEELWLREDTIICADGSWLIYRNRCHKEDAKIHDIFIAYASDKKWYYSDYHFCIGAMVVGMRGQSASLDDFRREFFLVPFDGESDDALDPTWKI